MLSIRMTSNEIIFFLHEQFVEDSEDHSFCPTLNPTTVENSQFSSPHNLLIRASLQTKIIARI